MASSIAFPDDMIVNTIKIPVAPYSSDESKVILYYTLRRHVRNYNLERFKSRSEGIMKTLDNQIQQMKSLIRNSNWRKGRMIADSLVNSNLLLSLSREIITKIFGSESLKPCDKRFEKRGFNNSDLAFPLYDTDDPYNGYNPYLAIGFDKNNICDRIQMLGVK